ncbi:hypothetical protein [Methylomonas rapida]|jgi:hypothetical protein|uniref:Uncharacterized protein n=1 Tax=Methylomonas rapida TaxID=2963939 RepID=A0ABY7GCU5_9GAMM|nr:hypothetical protein [Methylomonas rapida]WAR43122.1 hypothetical protein NM686_012015 [Methylomonas rapida]
MLDFSKFVDVLWRLNLSQIVLIILSALLIYFGPVLVKRKYLNRVGLEIDESIEDRNSWILYPNKYDFSEKFLMILIYLCSFLMVVLAANVTGL